jgi:hypothetical protein
MLRDAVHESEFDLAVMETAGDGVALRRLVKSPMHFERVFCPNSSGR